MSANNATTARTRRKGFSRFVWGCWPSTIGVGMLCLIATLTAFVRIVVSSAASESGGYGAPGAWPLLGMGLTLTVVLSAYVHAIQTARSKAEALVARRTAELARRAERLARSNAELEQFAYVASHDLKEPLRMVASYVALIADEYAESFDEQGHKYLHYAVDGARRMQALIDDLLLFSRVGRGERELSEVDLGEAARRAESNLQPAIEESGAKVDLGPLPRVLGRESEFVQLFQNLLSNAIKFRWQQPPVITVRAQRIADCWQVAVSDNGIGIDPAYGERIFRVFSRLHGRAAYPGNGIGLAICKKIVEQHGGEIWVESAPRLGATFRFTLPKCIAAHQRVEGSGA